MDIDVNIFLPVGDVARVFSALNRHNIVTAAELQKEVADREQVRIDWDGTPIDLFFAYDPFHDSCDRRAVIVDFFGHPIRVLSAEDIVIFKTLYNRPKDWPDVEQLLGAQATQFDAEYVCAWIGDMLPTDDSARTRLEALLARYSGAA